MKYFWTFSIRDVFCSCCYKLRVIVDFISKFFSFFSSVISAYDFSCCVDAFLHIWIVSKDQIYRAKAIFDKFILKIFVIHYDNVRCKFNKLFNLKVFAI